MAQVDASRRGVETNMSHAVDEARLIGFNNDGYACVWYGGYGFNVYDAANQWHEVDHFTSGELAGMTDSERRTDKGTEYAIARMHSEGFTPATAYYE